MATDPSVELGLTRATGHFWIDTGIVMLVQHVGPGQLPANAILRRLVFDHLVHKTGNKGEYYDELSGEVKEYDKVNWAYPASEFIKVVPDTEKITIDGNTYFKKPPSPELSLSFSKKPDLCDVCGDQAPVVSAKMWFFPFLVDPTKFSNFYSQARRALRLCPRCAVAGAAAHLGWLWHAHGRQNLHLFLFHSDLAALDRLHREVIQPLRLNGRPNSAAPVAFAGAHLHETTLGLLFALFHHIRGSDLLSPAARRYLAELLGAEGAPIFPLTLYAISGTLGKAFSMNRLFEFTQFSALYALYDRWLRRILQLLPASSPGQRVASIFRQFQTRRGNKDESIWRDKISRSILEFGDPLPHVEEFLFSVRVKEENPRPLLFGTIDVFDVWVQEVLRVNESFQRVLKGFGHALGEQACEHNEMGILYALRNAKNVTDFYRILNDSQFRLKITIPEQLLNIEQGERIDGNPWLRVKTMLSIYAMNAYLWKNNAGTRSNASDEGEE